MLDNLFVLHQLKGSFAAEIQAADALVWETCLRRIFFQLSSQPPLSESENWIHGEQAYEFLLETVCGLNSPVLGETEVMGQFREFMDKIKVSHFSAKGPLLRILESVFSDAKKIREKHLRGIGSRSYGSWVRKQIRGSKKCTLIGAGHLTRELLPWILKESERVTVMARRPEVAKEALRDFSNLRVLAIQESDSPLEAVLIAAPLSDSELIQWLELRGGCETLIDLRESAKSSSGRFNARRVLTLNDLFTDAQKVSETSDLKIQEARSEASRLAMQYRMRLEVRPFGWEDLCG
ncbi:MAG: hypothetical protein IT289_10845 [Oligoflexia bacterium]|nr:hypothetical protein [Oligoflexia bacterium]